VVACDLYDAFRLLPGKHLGEELDYLLAIGVAFVLDPLHEDRNPLGFFAVERSFEPVCDIVGVVHNACGSTQDAMGVHNLNTFTLTVHRTGLQ
jgi:hypothetical protein